MARVKRRPGIGRVTRYCVPVAAPSAPTILLDLNYATDTLLNASANPVSNGDPVDSWVAATGGTWTQALAVAAGADPQYLTYVAASGVHTAGLNAALTVATPVTIPADTACVIYIRCVVTTWPIFLGKSNGDGEISFDPYSGVGIKSSDGSAYYSAFVEPGPGTYLVRYRRTSAGVWSLAHTGQVEVGGGDNYAGAIVFDTLLGRGTAGSGVLNDFVASGQYLQKLYIYHGSSSPDTTYETNNGGVL